MSERLLIWLGAIVLHSCCGSGPWPVAGVSVKYPNITTDESVNAIRFKSVPVFNITDTIHLGNINESHQEVLADFDHINSDFIISVEGTQYLDTITDIYYSRSRCRDKLVDFEYKLNGKRKTAQQIEILNPKEK